MTQYLLAVYDTPGSREIGTPRSRYADDAAMQEAFARVGAFNQELQDRGVLVFAGGLSDPAAAMVVDASGSTASGPLPQAEHTLGGMWVIEAPNDEEARAWAAKGAAACGTDVEVRAYQG